MVRAAYVDKNGLKKGAWSQEEDNKLRTYILRYGHWNWRLLPKYAGLQRCGKSCRLRWMNYLKPGVRRGNYTKEEEDLIRKLHHELGNKWSAIAAKLPGRSDNEIKNHWHAHLNKCTTQSTKSEKSLQLKISRSDLISGTINSELNSSVEENCSPGLTLNSLALNWGTYDDNSTSSYLDPFSGFQDSFWTEPFVLDTSDGSLDVFSSLLLENGLASSYLSSFQYDDGVNLFMD